MIFVYDNGRLVRTKELRVDRQRSARTVPASPERDRRIEAHCRRIQAELKRQRLTGAHNV